MACPDGHLVDRSAPHGPPFGLRPDEENYEVGELAEDDDSGYELEGQVLRLDAPLRSGRYVVSRARKDVIPPLIVAVAISAAESEMTGESLRKWRAGLRTVETREPSAGLPVAKAARAIRRDFDELWPWSD